MNQMVHTELDNWVEEYTAELYSWAVHKVSDSELAKDLVQDTFLAAAEKSDTYKGESSPKTWLFGILNHKIVDIYRKKSKQTVKADSELLNLYFTEDGSWIKSRRPQNWEDEKHLLDDSAFLKVLQECLSALPERWGVVVKAKYLLSKKSDEICQELEIAPTNLWQIVRRAKLQLRECVELNWINN